MATVSHAWPYSRFTENTATLGERNFIERVKAPILFEQVLRSNSPNPI